MLVELKKENLTLESEAVLKDDVIYVLGDPFSGSKPPERLKSLTFEGFTGFNEQYVLPLLMLRAKHQPFFKCFYLTSKDKCTCYRLFNIINIRQTQFIFATLKTLGISLTELQLGFHVASQEHIKLYLHPKIITLLSKLDDSMKQQLVLYLVCLVKIMNSISICSNTSVIDSEERAILFEEDLTNLVIQYNNLSVNTLVECLALQNDSEYSEVKYVNNVNLTSPVKSSMGLKSTCEFVYNVLKTSKGSKLIIINKSYTPKDFYIIDMIKGIVYTNCLLTSYNLFDFTDWIPYLVSCICEINPKLTEFTVKHLDAEKLLRSSDEEIIINTDASEYTELLDNYSNITENLDMKLYDGFFKGSKIISDCTGINLKDSYDSDPFAQELYKQVQPYFDKFDLKDLATAIKGFANGDIYAMLFYGESGTGKSTAARVIPYKCGIPFIAINGSQNIEESDIIGTMIPNPNKNSADDPEFIWQDGALTKCVRNGYTCIFEEIGGARPGILMKLNSLLDDARQLDLPNGEVLKAHKNFRFIATTNIAYEGTNRFNKALVDRFEVCKKFDDLCKEEAVDIIVSRTGYANKDKILKIYDIYAAIKKYSTEQNLGIVVSIRRLLNIFKQGKYYKSAKDAVECLLLNHAFIEEPEHLKYFEETILKAFDLSFKL